MLLNFFSLLKTIYPRVLTKPLPNDAKSPLPVDVRRSKTLLLKVPREKTTATGGKGAKLKCTLKEKLQTSPGTCFLKVPIINGPGKLSPFSLKSRFQ